MAENACFLSLLMELRSHKTYYKGNKYMEIYRTILYMNNCICTLFHEEVRGSEVISI